MMPAPLRRFSTLRQNLPKSGENSLYERLGRWCQGGALGWVFDGDGAQAYDRLLDLHDASVIGLTRRSSWTCPRCTPVMMYLLRVMEELVDGQRLIYVISEFWKALDHAIFSDFAKQKQRRSANRMASASSTQSPSDVLRHPIGRTMVEQSVTKIFLANPEAVRESTSRVSGLSQAEFEIVRNLGAQGGRRFLVKQGHASALCELDLAGMDDFITVLSGTTDTSRPARRHSRTTRQRSVSVASVLLREVQHRKSGSRGQSMKVGQLAIVVAIACGPSAALAQFVRAMRRSS